jgi:hypothetical protein
MKKILLSALIVGIAATASAQTRTVAQSGTPDHATVAAALAFFNPDPDALTPNVIQITDSAVYDEIFEITVPVTIEGTGASRPVLTARTNPAGDANDGVRIDVAGEVTLRNLIIIPSTTTPPADDLVRSGPSAVTLTLEDLLVTVNNGSNAPVSTDGLTAVSLVGAVTNGDDGLFLAGTGTVATLTDVVVTHIQNASAGDDGLVCSSAATSYTINDGCVFSYNGRLGIQAAGGTSFVINAPTTRVKVLANQGFAGIWFAAAQTGTRSVNGCDVVGHATAAAFGIENQNRGTIPFTLSNSIIANNAGKGLVVNTVGTGDTTLTNVTIANNGAEAIDYITASTGGVVTATDSIFAGNGSAAATQILQNNSTFSFTLNNCALVTAGPQALTAPGTGGTGTFTLNSVINADPMFAEIANANSASFFDVQNSAYATAGTGSTPLKGAADFTPASEAGIWSMYN